MSELILNQFFHPLFWFLALRIWFIGIISFPLKLAKQGVAMSQLMYIKQCFNNNDSNIFQQIRILLKEDDKIDERQADFIQLRV